jgi:hypothetical protein
MSPRLQPKMAEPRAEERGTLRGPPLFRSAGDGRKAHKSSTHVVALLAVAREGIRGFLTSATTTVGRRGGIDRGAAHGGPDEGDRHARHF